MLLNSALDFTEERVREIIRFAISCGGIVCSGAGAIDPQPTQRSVKEFLNQLKEV